MGPVRLGCGLETSLFFSQLDEATLVARLGVSVSRGEDEISTNFLVIRVVRFRPGGDVYIYGACVVIIFWRGIGV